MKTSAQTSFEDRTPPSSRSKVSRTTKSKHQETAARKRKLRAKDRAEGIARLDDRVLNSAVPLIRRFIADNNYGAPERTRGRPKTLPAISQRMPGISVPSGCQIIETDQQFAAEAQQEPLRVSASEKATGHNNSQTTFFDEI